MGMSIVRVPPMSSWATEGTEPTGGDVFPEPSATCVVTTYDPFAPCWSVPTRAELLILGL